MTFSYLKKHFWLSLAVMSVPAIVCGLLYTPYWEVSFVATLTDPYADLGTTFKIVFGDSWQYLWPVIVVSIILVFASTLVMSAMDNHFRTGRLSLKAPWRRINYSIFPITIGVIVMSVISIMLRFVLYGLVSLVQVTGRAANMAPGAALAIISVIAVGIFVLHILIILPMLFWAPIMFVYGYRFRDAAASSFKLISGKKTFMGLLLPLIVLTAVQLIVGYLPMHTVVSKIINGAVFLITNMYVPTYVMIAFYEISGLDRRDINPYDIPLPIPAPVVAAKPEKNADKDMQGENSEKQGSPAKDIDKKPEKKNRDRRSAKPRKSARVQSKTHENTKARKSVKQASETNKQVSKKTSIKTSAESATSVDATKEVEDGV